MFYILSALNNFSDCTNQSNNEQIQSSNGRSEIGEILNNIETISVDKITSKEGESAEKTKLQETEDQGKYTTYMSFVLF